MKSKAEKTFSKKIKSRLAEKQNELDRFPAVFGDGTGNVAVPNQSNFNYVLIGDKVLPVFNNRVPARSGVKIWVGYAPEEPRLFQVLSTRSEDPTGGQSTPLGYAPAKRYEWNAEGGGQDPLAVHLRAFSPLKLGVSATGGLNVDLYRGYVWTGTDWLAIARQDIDMTAHIPAAAGKAALVMISIDDAGAVISTKGAEVDIADLVLSDLPAVPADTIFVCGAVRVYNGQTVIREGRVNTDFVDLRFPGYSAAGGAGGGVESVTGDGVDNTDPLNPVLTYPTPVDIGAIAVGGAVLSVTGDGVGGTATDPVLTFPTPGDIGAQVAGSYLTSANIEDSISDGVTTKAPSENAVFDALALKQDAGSALTIEGVQDDLGGTTGGDGFIKTADGHLTISYNDGAPSLTLQVIHNIPIAPTGIEFGSTSQEYDITGTTWISAVAGGTLGGIPDETSVGHKLADCLAAIATSRNGTYLSVREKTGAASATNPNTIQFLFSSVTDFNNIRMRSYYVGTASHNVSIQLWNFLTSVWDTYVTFSNETGFVDRNIEVFSPQAYISAGVVKLQVIHTSTGLATHRYEFDYVALNDGGGGSGGSVNASTVAFTPAGNVAATNVQSAIEELDTEKVPTARTIAATAPLTIDGGASADLSANRTIAISAATTGAAGSMSAADKTKLDGMVTHDGSLMGDGTAATPLTTASGATTATAAGTTTLTVASERVQEFTGTLTQSVLLPDVTTLRLGDTYIIDNQSQGLVTVKSSASTTIEIVAGGRVAIFRCVKLTGTDSTSWRIRYVIATDQMTRLDTNTRFIHVFGARLTLETGVPVSKTDQTAKTTLYLTPFNGNQIGLYDGDGWTCSPLNADISISLAGLGRSQAYTNDPAAGASITLNMTNTAGFLVNDVVKVSSSAGSEEAVITAIVANTSITVNNLALNHTTTTPLVTGRLPYDVFVYDNAGTLTLELVAWTNGTTRATALTNINGVPCKDGSPSKRYCGTICTTTTIGQCEISFGVTPAAGGSKPELGVYNEYNKVDAAFMSLDSTDSWAYTTAAWRAKNAAVTNGLKNQFRFINGGTDFSINGAVIGIAASSSAGVAMLVGIANGNISTRYGLTGYTNSYIATYGNPITAAFSLTPATGTGYLQELEYGGTNVTFYGDVGAATVYQTGAVYHCKM